MRDVIDPALDMKGLSTAAAGGRRRQRKSRGGMGGGGGERATTEPRVWTMQQLRPSNELINFEMMHYIHNQLAGSYFIIRTWLKLVGVQKKKFHFIMLKYN